MNESGDGRRTLSGIPIAALYTPEGLAGGGFDPARELGQQAPDWLAEAEAAFAAGANIAGSRRLWEATRAAIAALAIRRGLAWEREQDMFRLMVQLDQEAGGGYTYLGRFGVAQSFRDNVEGVLHWEDWEFEYCRPAVERLVFGLTEMARSVSGNNGGRGDNGERQAA